MKIKKKKISLKSRLASDLKLYYSLETKRRPMFLNQKTRIQGKSIPKGK